MKALSSILLGLVGILHLVPAVGVLSAVRLEGMYGVEIDGADLAVLMRHRAVLFGIVGGLMVFGAVFESYRQVALVVGLVTTISFVLIVWLEGASGTEVRRVALADGIAVAMLIASVVLDRLSQAAGSE